MALFDFSPSPGGERDYWLERAAFHLDLGERTADTRASWAHYQLAGRYLDRAYGGAPVQRRQDHVLIAEIVAG